MITTLQVDEKDQEKDMLLEIACFNLPSAIAAAQAGADRIELCDNPQDGGTTLSYGIIKIALEKIAIPVFPIIRPRGGDFLYDIDEFTSMLYDVALCRQLGCKGVVLGLLQSNGTVDKEKTARLVDTAGDMEVTFHRAFDRTVDPVQALEDVIATGCKRLLTSGQKETAEEGTLLIQQLIKQAAGRIIVMPGSGVRSNNIAALANETGATELHSSARMQAPSSMQYLSPNFTEDATKVMVNAEEVGRMREQISNRNA